MATSGQLFVGGKIFTGRGEDDFATAFRIADGHFVWVGDQDQVDRTEAIDLAGRTVLPGLLDVHVHPAVMAVQADMVDCLPPAVRSMSQLLNKLRTHPANGAGPDRWIVGSGYDDSAFPEARPPTARDLDEVSTSQPVFVNRCDGHSAACNTRALELAGITAATPDPLGARFERDSGGHPTGVLTEIGAVDAVQALIPQPAADQLIDRLVELDRHFLSRGITAMCDPYATVLPDPLAMFREAERRGFRPRCAIYYAWDDRTRSLPDLADVDRTGRVHFAGLKLFMDGAYSNRTAWVCDPYPGSADTGMRLISDEQARAAVDWARRNRVQVAIHAMGDRALRQVLDLFGDDEPWLDGRPSIRLEHATLVSPRLISRLNRSRMTFGIATHTIFLFAEHDSYRRNLDPERAEIAYPIRSLYESVPVLALSSDCPATAWSDADNVFVSIRAAVQRLAHNGADIGQDSAVTVPQALLLYTDRARHLADLGPVGHIEPGFEGSFVVLDRDIFTIPPEEIDQVRVVQTWVSGELAYQGEDSG